MRAFNVLLAALSASALLAAAYSAQAASAEEVAAAKETYIDGLRLYTADAALAARGVKIAYVETDTSPGGGRYECGALSPSQLKAGAKRTAMALGKLPASAWDKIDLKYVLLCSEAKANGRVIGGIPVPPLKLLMLATGNNPEKSTVFPYTVLHELYHMIEMQQNQYKDAEWDKQFSGYDNSYGAQAGKTTPGSGGAGFINGYGKSFAHEERAELFAMHLLSGKPLSDFIAQKGDSVLAKKQQYIIEKCNRMLGAGACR